MHEEKKRELQQLKQQLQKDLASIEGQINQLARQKQVAVEQFIRVTSQLELIEEFKKTGIKEDKELIEKKK